MGDRTQSHPSTAAKVVSACAVSQDLVTQQRLVLCNHCSTECRKPSTMICIPNEAGASALEGRQPASPTQSRAGLNSTEALCAPPATTPDAHVCGCRPRAATATAICRVPTAWGSPSHDVAHHSLRTHGPSCPCAHQAGRAGRRSRASPTSRRGFRSAARLPGLPLTPDRRRTRRGPGMSLPTLTL